MTGGFTGAKASWIQAALDGNDLGNHTVSHKDLTGMDSATLVKEISGQAEALRALDPLVEAVTLAYPYCSTNALVDRITDRENLIARTCGGDAQFSWSSKPSNWMRMTSFIVQDTASAASALVGIDKAATNGNWFVTLDHGVGIAREADGSYAIDFMQKTLQVAKSSSTGIDGTKAQLRSTRTRKGLKLSGMPFGTDPGLAKDISGRIWRRL